MRTAGILNILVEANTGKAVTNLRKADAQLSKTARTARTATKPIQLKADTSRATRNLKTTERQLGRTERAGHKLSGGFGKLAKGAAAAAAAYVGLGAAKDAIQTTEDLAKTTISLHKSFGLSVASASEWAGVLKSRGVETTKVNMAFKTLAANVTAATKATGPQRDIFKELGVSVEDLRRLKPEDLMGRIADGIQKLPPGWERANAGAKLFGRGWQSIIPLLREGSKGMNEQLALARKYGVTFRGHSIKSMQEFIAAQRESKLAMMGLQIAFTTHVVPALTKVILGISRFVSNMRTGKGVAGQLSKTIHDLRPAFHALGVAVKIAAFTLSLQFKVALFIARTQIKLMAAAFRGLLGLGRVAARIGHAIARPLSDAWTTVRHVFRVGTSRAGDAFGDMGKGVKRIAGRIKVVLTTTMSAAWGAVRRIFKKGTSLAGAAFGQMGKGIGRIAGRIGHILGSLGSAVGGVAAYIAHQVERIGKAFGKAFKIGSSIVKFVAPKIPTGQTGGSVFADRIGRQRGGHINQGKPSGDSVPAMLERGEYVLNRNAVRKVGKRRLDELNFRRAKRFQKGGEVKGYITGGQIASQWGTNTGTSRMGAALLNQFPGLIINAGRESGHAAHSLHHIGAALDIGPQGNYLNRAAAWLRGRFGRSLAEGIHNPNLSIKGGQSVPPSFWGAATWAQHLSHIHAGVLGALGLGGLGGGAGAQQIPPLKIRGRGPMADIARGAAGRMRGAANAYLGRIAPMGGDQALTGFHGPWTQVMAHIARSRGWNLGDWKRIVQHESSGIVSNKNPSSTAFGLGQLLDSTTTRYGGGPGSSGTEQIIAMARYIEDRYGNPTKAWQFWQGHHWYSKGGPVGMAGGGPTPAQRRRTRATLGGISRMHLSKGFGRTIDRMRGEVARMGEYAEGASGLADNGTGVFHGHNEIWWLKQQLRDMLKLRNAMIRAYRMLLHWKKRLEHLIHHPGRGLTRRERTSIRSAARKQLGAVKGRMNDLLTSDMGIDELQGRFGPMRVLKGMPALGTLGGSIEDIQVRLRDFGAHTSDVSDTTGGGPDRSAQVELLQGLLQDANLRTALSQRQFEVLRGLPFAGSFQTMAGQLRTVPGATNQPMAAVVHGGETIGRPGGLSVAVYVHENGGGADVYVNERKVEATVKKVLRGETRRVGRTPGGAR